MSTGIYKITNLINNNAYIGLSINIEKRWRAHIKRSQDATNKEYNKVLYKAFRKYGIDNFKFEILEECIPQELKEKEIYWINYYDTYKNGYNATAGGDLIDNHGEKHPNHKITESDVIEIRQLWASKTISTREMYYEYQDKIAKTGFKKIYTWQTWKNILPELNTEENRSWHRNNGQSYANPGEKNPKAKITDEEFEDIKKRYLNREDMHLIFQDYKDKYSSYNSFYNTNKKRIDKEIIRPVSTISVAGE